MILNPSILNEKENNIVNQDLFSALFSERIIFIFNEITDELSASVISQLIYLDSISNDDITIYINSPGGSVSAGLAIYDTMNFIKSDVRTICIGMAASMAAIILSSGTKGKRFALKNADVLIHQPLGGVSGQASDIAIISNRILGIKERLNNILAENTGQAKDKINVDTDRDNYLSALEAKEYGLIDDIIEKR